MALNIGSPRQGEAAQLIPAGAGLPIQQRQPSQREQQRSINMSVAASVQILREQTRQAIKLGKFDSRQKLRMQVVEGELAKSLKAFDADLKRDAANADFNLEQRMQQLQSRLRREENTQLEAGRSQRAANVEAGVSQRAAGRALLDREKFASAEKTRAAGAARQGRLDVIAFGDRKLRIERQKTELALKQSSNAIAQKQLKLSQTASERTAKLDQAKQVKEATDARNAIENLENLLDFEVNGQLLLFKDRAGKKAIDTSFVNSLFKAAADAGADPAEIRRILTDFTARAQAKLEE